ncbi:phage tail assembly protein [Acetobacter cibinongensis]|uniref:Phage protein n=1 Tax=Acetobacter cibinongensis TaxID=146475 RepID=A0A1Z5YW50_9PROT|nr:phage tail assembly protein [Acetobacter cibinongensis]OUJ03200.1 hypothetical protein HK14_03305 [Acetobacter cibinongensis]
MTDEEVLSAVSELAPAEEVKPGTFTLDAPITLKGGEQFDTLTLSEPTVYHQLMAARIIGKTPTLESIYNSQIDTVRRLSGWPQLAIDQLPSNILDDAVDYTSSFDETARRKPEEVPECPPSLLVSLPTPIEATGKQYSTLELRPPMVGERRAFKVLEGRGTFEGMLLAEIDLVEKVSGWPKAAVLKMPISIFARAADYLTGFFIRGQTTGNAFQQT